MMNIEMIDYIYKAMLNSKINIVEYYILRYRDAYLDGRDI